MCNKAFYAQCGSPPSTYFHVILLIYVNDFKCETVRNFKCGYLDNININMYLIEQQIRPHITTILKCFVSLLMYVYANVQWLLKHSSLWRFFILLHKFWSQQIEHGTQRFLIDLQIYRLIINSYRLLQSLWDNQWSLF